VIEIFYIILFLIPILFIAIKFKKQIKGVKFIKDIKPYFKEFVKDGNVPIGKYRIPDSYYKNDKEKELAYDPEFMRNKVVEILDIATKGAVSNVNRTTGMDTVGLLSQIGIMNPFNRKQESEADYLGLIFASLSGYDIRETVKIWERMREANKGKEPPEFMSTHPSSTNRINNITSWINEVTLEYPPIS